MAHFITELVKETRRSLLNQRKRMSLAWYEFTVKTQMGRNPDAAIDSYKMQVMQRSLNLLDFERNREKDLFMVDVSSDRSEYGGVSDTELAIVKDTRTGDTYLNIEARLKKDRSGLVPIDYMFSGFKCHHLVKKDYDWFNGFRITMRRPPLACKFGAYIVTSFSEVEHYSGHIVDVKSRNHSGAQGVSDGGD